MKVLGFSCSLRNARFGAGSEALIEEIKQINTQNELLIYLKNHTKIRSDDFIAAGRDRDLPFDKIYEGLKKLRGDRGLSNSEASLVAGLWGAHQEGAEITHLGIGPFFPMNGKRKNLDKLRERILKADAILVSGPVYFGDRSSLAQELFEFLYSDPECAAHVRGKLYAGIAVGAKRNGGQETTLVYQILDATNLNMLAVGNDSKTTSQYGGTAVAGDVGTLYKDEYGIDTSVGTGRRLAKVGLLLEAAKNNSLKKKVKIQIWLLQDSMDDYGYNKAIELASYMMENDKQVEVKVINFTNDEIYRCIACDICPIKVGPPEEYRCIINSGKDAFVNKHVDLLDTDGIILGAYSPVQRSDIKSVYQRFMERTRYLRRDDYVLSDKVVAPFVISEVNSNQNLHVRMLTSLVRHQTVLHHPLIGIEYQGELLNDEQLKKQALSFAEQCAKLTLGKLSEKSDAIHDKEYNPVGYIISKEAREEDKKTGKVAQAIGDRRENLQRDREKRLCTKTEVKL